SYYVYEGGTALTVTSTTVSGNSVILTLLRNVTVGRTITATFIPGNLPLQDRAGNAAAAFTGFNVINDGSSYGTGGQLLGAAVQGTQLTLTFNSTLDSNSVPLASQFYVKVNSNY